jgi:hypothetical protein
VVCQHVVESAERCGEYGGIRGGGGDRFVRRARSIEVGTGMLGGAVGGAAGRPVARWKLTMVVVGYWGGRQARPSIGSSAMATDATATSTEVAAVEWSSAVCLVLLRKLLWRSKSQLKLYSMVVLVDHDGVECAIRGVGRGRGGARRRAKAQVAARLAAAARESAGGSSAAHLLSIVFTPGFFCLCQTGNLEGKLGE